MNSGKLALLCRAAASAWRHLWIAVLLTGLGSPLGAVLSGSIEGPLVQISGARPGASLVLVSMSRDWAPAAVRVTRVTQVLVDSDGDGALHYESVEPIPSTSIWIVLDPDTAENLVLVPKDGKVHRATLPREALELGGDQSSAVLSIDTFAELAFFAARPSVGLFHATVSDGGNLDLDLEFNSEIRADLSRLPSIAEDGVALGSLRGDELLFGIDPRTLTPEGRPLHVTEEREGAQTATAASRRSRPTASPATRPRPTRRTG